jgi:hypothetical protein
VLSEFRPELIVVPPAGIVATDTWNMDVIFTPDSVSLGLYRTWATSVGQPVAQGGWSYIYQPLLQATSYRLTHAGITCELVANALADQGNAFGGQTGCQKSLYIAGGTPFANCPTPPLTPQLLLQEDPAFYQGLARRGVYMPLKYRQPTTGLDYAQIAGAVGTTQPNTQLTYNQQGVVLAGVGTPPVNTDYGNNMNTGIVLFTGLAPGATVLLKARVGYESVSPLTAWFPFMVPASPLDNVALAAVANAQQYTPNAYEAAANDFWSILRSIGRAVSGKVPRVVADALGAAGIPIISSLSQAAGMVMRAWD